MYVFTFVYLFYLSIIHISNSIILLPTAFQYNLKGSTICKCMYYSIIYASLLHAICIYLCNHSATFTLLIAQIYLAT